MISANSILLIDIGGIFFSPEWRDQGIAYVSKELNIKQDDFRKALEKNKQKFYIGRMDESEYWRTTLNLLGLDTNLSTYLARKYRSFVTPINNALDLLPKLSKKYTLISFNNSSKEWMDYRIKLFSLDKYFVDFFTSGYTHYLKPSKMSFMNVLKKFSHTSLTYLDDNEDYLQKAITYHVRTIFVSDYKDLLKLL